MTKTPFRPKKAHFFRKTGRKPRKSTLAPVFSQPVASGSQTIPDTLDLKDIKELIALMRKNDLSVFKLEEQGFKITLKRGADPIITTVSAPVALQAPVAAPAAGTVPAGAPATAPVPAASSGEKLKEITSPMVGTFYASPSPEAQPFAKPGQSITPDSVVCIIEAMKVMNEIKAECQGTIVEVVAENGKPVQFGQVLFRVRQ